MVNRVLPALAIPFSTLILGLVCPFPSWSLPLSPGDRIKLTIPEGELFNGTYEVNLDGTLNIPHLQPIKVAGLEPPEIEQTLTTAFINNKLFNPAFIQTSVQVVEWAPIQVNVSGATFQTGRILINQRTPDARSRITQASGDYSPERFLTAAIRAAGGVMPNADIQNVQLIRNGKARSIDLSGVLEGDNFNDVPLMAGDRIVVPDAGKFQNQLVRPSQITIEGVRIFLSNLTQPAAGNAGNASAGISRDATAFKYGSRLSQAVIAGNCAGGSVSNSRRRAVLVRTDRMTGKTQVVDRAIEDLLRNSTEDTNNPLLLPDDGIACYDSKSTNLRGVAETLSTIFSPFTLLFNLFR
ncbi:polysaccharide export protein [Pseudanabaenaceae cyanobacterium LEGE 13415]|nr:polysaccharide export protein [Pseudanabaenaceae cyanobacterium LEGE 13415]